MSQQQPPLSREATYHGCIGWIDCGNVGLIDAACIAAKASNRDKVEVYVRDKSDPGSIYKFHMRRECKYTCENPRQGAD